MRNIFTVHPHSVGESYWRHMGRAVWCGGLMLYAGFACLVHSIFPFLFTSTASEITHRLSALFHERSGDVQDVALTKDESS